MVKVFFSYSHKDEILRNTLETHLSLLKRQGVISTWHDRRIGAGNNFANEIDDNLLDSDIILLLISSDFLASDYCHDVEMMKALERNAKNEALVIPIILRQCDWKNSEFKHLLALPQDGKPVTLHANQDVAFHEITSAIRDAIDKLGKKSVPKLASQKQLPSISPSKTSLPRSSNLYVKKRFTDQDKMSFINDGFEYIAVYFQESLTELQTRNPEITGNYKRVDANQFTAHLFRHGTEATKCRIFLSEEGGWGHGVAYSEGSSTSQHNSINDMISIIDTEQLLYFKAGNFFTNKSNNLMTQHDAAEYFWAHFIEPLQR